MKYSYEFKESIVKKALSGRNVKEVANETGVAAWSIYQWIRQLNNGNLKSGGYIGAEEALLSYIRIFPIFNLKLLFENNVFKNNRLSSAKDRENDAKNQF